METNGEGEACYSTAEDCYGEGFPFLGGGGSHSGKLLKYDEVEQGCRMLQCVEAWGR